MIPMIALVPLVGGQAEGATAGAIIVALLKVAGSVEPNDGERRPAVQIGFDDDDLLATIAVEIGQPGLQIFEYGVIAHRDNGEIATAMPDAQRRRFQPVPKHAVAVPNPQ